MSRRIITLRDFPPATFTAAARASAASTVDGYRDKLVKYIPAEIVSAYISTDLLIHNSKSSVPNQQLFCWLAFGFFLFMTPIYLWRVQRVDNGRGLQLLLSTLAFAVWVFAMGGPFLTWTWIAENRVVGALVLTAYTFLIPIFDPDLFAKKPS